jgi:diacylglycerol O-acyltransferase
MPTSGRTTLDPSTTADLRASWGGSQQMSAWDAIMWRAEGDPRTSSTGMLVELLDSEPEWTRFLAAHRTAVRQIPRLRERVVQPALPIVQPVWSPDPDFDLDHHVRCVDLGGSATRADVMAHCESIWAEPLDRARPPWQATLVNGMADGRSAYVFKVHHAMTDGMGLVQLLDLTHSSTATPTAIPDDSQEDLTGSRATTSSVDLLAHGLADWAADVPSRASGALGRLGRVLGAPWRSGEDAVRYGRSLGRLLGVMPPRSPLLAGSGAENRLLLLDLDLDDLKSAGRAAGGSVNDAYVAAVLGGLRIYHERYGVDVDRIPIAMPVSLRSSDDPGGGNKFAGVRFSAPLSEPDPAARIRMVGEFVRDVRREPAITYLDSATPTLSKLPSAAIVELTARATAVVDMQISNIPGLRRPAYIAGARVLGTYALGPRPGVAAMVTMMTLEGLCCIGLNVDAQAFPRLDILEECLQAGFREVLDLAGHVEAER